ncbi:excalibur calcium-binding domain-containing protein [Niallia taxi]|uniref:excalibur calcium-binding domain-containing protein n=1 Tax=Niallia taxi TaxID=2499688 RepID=UPI00204076F2|nr:excalibur calcium-binding domain-containing protein [Niallia taxi]MCM3217751.1 excalibur calcium-binding domain-containing protein [Niallia taxi]
MNLNNLIGVELMKKRAIILLVILVLFSLFCLVGSLWSLIGLIIVGFGFFQYIRKSKGLPSIRRPLIITWVGVLLTFFLTLATVDTPETNNTASSTDAKVAAEKAKAEEEAEAAAEKAKAEEEAKAAAEKAKAEEEAKAAAEKAKAEEEAKAAAEKAKAEEEAKAAAEKAKAEEEARVAAEKAKAEEEARVAAEKAKAEEEAKISNLAYDPFGPDRNCSDFSTGAEAQEFYLAAGGPSSDPHDLDRDNDGNACDWNP